MKTVYMDNNAITKTSTEGMGAMLPYMSRFYGNPSSTYAIGAEVSDKIEEARTHVANLIGAEPEEIIFTSGGTESDNTAIRSALSLQPDKKTIVTSSVEHPAIRSLCRYLDKNGYRIIEIPVNRHGELDIEKYRESLNQDTALATLMWANNETGVLFPVEKAAEIAREKGILFHTDAVQAAEKIDINVKNTAIDMLSLSGHKIYGPKGIGVLYVRSGASFSPMMIGGHQEAGRRAGTENTPGIIGLGKASELAAFHLKENSFRIRKMRNRLEKGIIESVSGTVVNGYNAPRLPNTSNISFGNIDGESVLLMLDEIGIAVSTGSACSAGSPNPSHVLLAMGISPLRAKSSVRFSLGINNSAEDIEYVLENIPGIIEQLRSISPLVTTERKAA
jgi:cysteine desulfurase